MFAQANGPRGVIILDGCEVADGSFKSGLAPQVHREPYPEPGKGKRTTTRTWQPLAPVIPQRSCRTQPVMPQRHRSNPEVFSQVSFLSSAKQPKARTPSSFAPSCSPIMSPSSLSARPKGWCDVRRLRRCLEFASPDFASSPARCRTTGTTSVQYQ